MKLTFFLIAFFLVLLRVYFSWAGVIGHNRSDRGNITVTAGNYIEELHWSGKVRLSDDEKSITDITPGGYLKFRENDTTFKAESNLQGEIGYTLYDGHESLTLDDSGRRFVAGVLQKMIARGLFSDGRAERIAQRGGNQALLTEISHLQMEGTVDQYLDLLLQSDSLTEAEQIAVLKQIGSMGDGDKEKYLSRFTPAQLKDSIIGPYWLATVGQMSDDGKKKDLVMHYIGQVGDSSGLSAIRWDSVMSVVAHMDPNEDKKELYKVLIDSGRKTDAEWIGLIRSVARMEDEGDRSEMLLHIAPKMPAGDSVKAEYKTAARTIKDDADYGKAMRAIE